MNTIPELSLDDARLAKRLGETLDRAISEPDPLWDARVAQIVAQAQRQQKRSHRWQWSGGLALAASVAFMVVLPGDWLIKASGTETTQARPASSSIDGQMLEEIDWLMSMEDTARGQR
ncbi:MAG: hypothetical protein ABIR53_05940 [Paraperlucidibaca sp.]